MTTQKQLDALSKYRHLGPRAKTTHGHTRNGRISRTYRIWDAMWQRCTNSKSKGYKWYGGKGITVCARWHSFENFLKDMGEVPLRATIDRKNNRKGYSPSNCRWATQQEQAHNKSSNHLLTFRGVTMNLTQWSEKTGIKLDTLRGRLQWGWDLKHALTVPARRGNRYATQR